MVLADVVELVHPESRVREVTEAGARPEEHVNVPRDAVGHTGATRGQPERATNALAEGALIVPEVNEAGVRVPRCRLHRGRDIVAADHGQPHDVGAQIWRADLLNELAVGCGDPADTLASRG